MGKFLSPKSVLGSAGSKNISYDRKRKEPSGPICLHICAVLNPNSWFILQISYFPLLPQIPFDIYHCTINCVRNFPRWFWNCTCDLSATFSSAMFRFLFLCFQLTFCKAFSILLVQTTLIHIIAQSVLSFCKLLWHDLSARSIFCSYNSKVFVGTVHFIWLHSFYSSWLLLCYRHQ